MKIVAPSVLTMSGSSTPSSWTLVVEKAGAASFALVLGAEGAEVSVGARAGMAGSASGSTPRPGAPWVWAKWRCA